jgi:PBSX family phage terminase large subunit
MSQEFKKTTIQKKALELLSSDCKHISLLGGSRSGKSFIILYALFVRACKVKSRQVALRKTFNSIKTSLWMDTAIKVSKVCFPNLPLQWNKTDYFITFPNGSELWFAGLDDDKRVEKILGKEYSSIFFNEITQMDYRSVQMALTRLAEKNDLKKKAYYDLNPSEKTHWGYYQFIKKLNPADNEPLLDPDNYAWLRMNPKDNIENIDQDYLNMLKSMPERERMRFLDGEFQDESDGQVYYEFRREDHVKDFQEYPGTKFIFADFNVMPHCSVVAQVINGQIQVIDEWFLENSDTPKAVFEWSKKYKGARVIPDSTGRNRKTSGQSDFDIIKAAGFIIESTYNPFVKDRVNLMNLRLKEGKILIHPRCKKLINDLEKVQWRNNELDQKTDPMLTHISDALGYGCHKLLPQTTLNLTPSTKVR